MRLSNFERIDCATFGFSRNSTPSSMFRSCADSVKLADVMNAVTPSTRMHFACWQAGDPGVYIDIRKALDPSADREEAIVGVPEDRIVKGDFGHKVVLDLSTAELEYASLMYPVSQAFDWDNWQDGFGDYWTGDRTRAFATNSKHSNIKFWTALKAIRCQ
jgi:hypothetical protein